MRTRIALLMLLAVAQSAMAQIDSSVLNGLKWREIGPWRGGRANAAAGVPSRPNEFYAGYTGGGVWKTTDAGVNWTNVSDGYFKTGCVGAIDVSLSNPDTVYVGMGEHAIRGNTSHGDGVYRSDDAGKTWRHLGLKETLHIGRIRVHPTDPNTVWVAALGPVYSASRDRGIYKTTDGGKTWKKTLFVTDRAGAIDICLAPSDPKTLYASTWEAWRTPYSLNSGGPGSKLWKSTDGGETWQEMSRNPGLPAGVLGKMGVAVSASKPNRVYAMIESAQGGVYRSEDAGATWTKVNSSADLRQRPWYYTQIAVDPKDDATVYVLNVAYHKSTNGGQSFSSGVAGHSDHHDIWIDPNDGRRLAIASDGGVSVSVDGGRSWSEQDVPTAQFYHVNTDNAWPYRILGAQQDNSTVRIASRTFGRGIGRADWTPTAGGESGYVVAKPDDPDIVLGGSYGGYLTMENHRTGQEREINAWPENPMGDGVAPMRHRFQWTFPIVFSPHDPDVVYVGSQHVLRSRDLGGSWEQISPDLTTNDKSKQGSSGGPITQDNTSVEYYCTVFTIAESPKKAGIIWVGSDDGLIHVTQDNGKTWRNVTPSGMPKWALISMIEASPHDAGTAWAAVDNHENGDFAPYIYVTTDYGRTWSKRVNGIPGEDFVRVVREDPAKKGLLFAGTETGVYASADSGATWTRFQSNLPVVPIHDLAIKGSDLIAATHGRSFWLVDDFSPLRQLDRLSPGRPTVFATIPGFTAGGGGFGGGGRAADPNENLGANPLSGLIVNYYLPREASNLAFEMIDAKGVVVATASPSAKGAGMNRISMVPRYPGPKGFPGMRMWSGAPGSLKAPPGQYTLRMKVDGGTFEAVATWGKDPRTPATDADLVEQYRFSKVVADRTEEANMTVVKIRDLRKKLDDATKGDSGLERAAANLQRTMTEVEEAIYQTKAQSGQDFLNYPIRLNNKLAALVSTIQTGNFRPTKQSYDVFEHLSKQLQVQLDKLNGAIKVELPKVNAALRAAGKSEVTP